MSEVPRADEIAEIRELLRAAGLRSTTARIVVLQKLRATNAPLTHADLTDELVPQGFDKATVYRNLVDLAECGLLKRTELGDHVWRYEFRDPHDPSEAEHPHFVCTECGSVSCLPEFPLAPQRKKHWTQIARVTEVLLKGVCRECDAN